MTGALMQDQWEAWRENMHAWHYEIPDGGHIQLGDVIVSPGMIANVKSFELLELKEDE